MLTTPTLRIASRVALGAAVLVATAFLAASAGTLFGFRTMIVTSGSMEPAIHAGDAVVIRAASSAAPGDVITFRPLRSHATTTHRVVSAREIDGVVHYQTHGDANQTPDADLVPAPNVAGKVVFRVPHGGRALAICCHAKARVALVVLPALLLVAGQWRTLRRAGAVA